MKHGWLLPGLGMTAAFSSGLIVGRDGLSVVAFSPLLSFGVGLAIGLIWIRFSNARGGRP